MRFECALDELYATGWTASSHDQCCTHSDGRAFPDIDHVVREFKSAGFDLLIRRMTGFDCVQAEWLSHEDYGESGRVIGATRDEAAVYAFAQLRRRLSTVGC